MINVVGIGPGNMDLIIDKAIKCVSESEIIIGGKRQVDIIEDLLKSKYKIDIKDKCEIFGLGSNFEELREYINSNLDKKIVVLASGDPLIYGIGDYIIRNFSEYTEVNIISGISSIQYMFSKIGINMNDVYITSCHGRYPNFDVIFSLDKVAMVTDGKIGPREIAKEIKSRKLDYKIFVGEDLSYEDEVITIGTPDEILKREEYNMSVVVVIKNR